MTESIRTISSREFATAFALRPQNISWLLGAGASAASGVPTGYMMIRDFKKRIFCRDAGYPLGEVDGSDPIWVERIASFLRQHSSLPPDGAPTEYSAIFEALYPHVDQRRQYIEDAVRQGTPSFAHRLLASLISAKLTPCVFTTNFDPLVEEAVVVADELLPAEGRARPTVAAIDSAERAVRCLKEGAWPLIAKLHGDYQSSQLKNTTGELQEQDVEMRRVLTSTCERFGLVIVGYSGRDESVMAALEGVLRSPQAYPGGLYWVTSVPSKVLPAVQRLLANAHLAGVNVAIVQAQTFNELAGDIVKQVTLPSALSAHVMQYQERKRLEPAVIPQYEARKLPVLRYSALLVENFPTRARRLVLNKPITIVNARELLKEKRVRAVVAANGTELAAFGLDSNLVDALAPYGARVEGFVQLDPAGETWALGLIYDALVRACCRGRPLVPMLKRSGHALIVARGKEEDTLEQVHARRSALAELQKAYQAPLTGKVDNLGFPFAEGLHLKLEQFESRWWCGFEPFTSVDLPRRDASSKHEAGESGAPAMRVGDSAADWRRERWAQRYNKQWATIIDAWVQLFTRTGNEQLFALGVPEGEGVDAAFSLSPVTAWSRPSHDHPYFARSK